MSRLNLPKSPATALNADGFSLIEVLIALLVLSIGLAGMASLHLNSLKSAHSSYYRSLASTAALNIEERVWQRANELLTDPGACVPDATIESLEGEIATAWKPGGVSSVDWGQTAVADSAGIPGLAVDFGSISTASVVRVDAGNDGAWTDAWKQFTVSLSWAESRLGDEQTTESFDYTIRIPCVPVFIPNST